MPVNILILQLVVLLYLVVFSVGDVVSIYNNSNNNQTITKNSGVTLRIAGTSNTSDRTLAQYGLATILCVASNVFVIIGSGLT